MIFNITEKVEANQKQFNYNINKQYDIQSIVNYNGVITITANITELEKVEIEVYYDSLSPDFTTDSEYFQTYLKEAYIINSINGEDLVFENTAKLNISIRLGVITVVEGEAYGEQVKDVSSELNQGYFHSAYYKHIAVTPIISLQSFHDDVTVYLKDYVNTNYPIDFHIP